MSAREPAGAVAAYLRELEAELHVRGRSRRRFLAECGDHLADSAAIHGEAEAVRRFGPARELARSFDAEVACRRAITAAPAAALGVLAVAISTLVLVNAADPHASAVPVWAVVFFAGAQLAGTAAALALLRAAAMRYEPATPADVLLLCRRSSLALTFALVTLFAAGAAVPGRASPLAVLLGPALALLAFVPVLRAARLARAVARSVARPGAERPARVVRPPLADVLTLVRRPGPRPVWSTSAVVALVPTLVVGVVGALVWDRLDGGTATTSAVAAGIEAGLIVGGFVLLGPALGLGRVRRSQANPC